MFCPIKMKQSTQRPFSGTQSLKSIYLMSFSVHFCYAIAYLSSRNLRKGSLRMPDESGETGETSASTLLSKLHDFCLFLSKIQLISAFSLPTFTVISPGLLRYFSY